MGKRVDNSGSFDAILKRGVQITKHPGGTSRRAHLHSSSTYGPFVLSGCPDAVAVRCGCLNLVWAWFIRRPGLISRFLFLFMIVFLLGNWRAVCTWRVYWWLRVDGAVRSVLAAARVTLLLRLDWRLSVIPEIKLQLIRALLADFQIDPGGSTVTNREWLNGGVWHAEEHT